MASRFVATLAAAGVVFLGVSGFAASDIRPAGPDTAGGRVSQGRLPPETPGLKAPVLKHTVYPRYTSDAMRAKLQGVVEVQAVVMPDGSVSRARVTTSLDKAFGLDEQAVIAAKQWTFEPGELNGKSVPVAVSLKLEFRLH